jgi:hypothetical protein
MTNKKIASEIAIGIILLLTIVIGGIFWVQSKRVAKEITPTTPKQIQQQVNNNASPTQQDTVANSQKKDAEKNDATSSDRSGIVTSYLQKCLEDDCGLFIKEKNKIVKAVATDNSESLIILNSDGSNEQVLVEKKFAEFDGKVMSIIGYSNGGRYVYYSPEQPDGLGGAYIFGGVYGGMNRIDLETKKIDAILTTENTGAIYNVSMDGNWVAYETYAGGDIPYYYPQLNKKVVDFNGLILKNINGGEDRKIAHRTGYIRFGNSIFSPDSSKVAYEEEKGEDPDARQYDAIVENVNNGSGRAIFENCSLAAAEWEKNTSSWIDDRYLLIKCSDENYYKVDTANNNKKEKVELTPEMKKWNVFN